ncbi:MAG: NAD(P)-dependent alcohol dehydrogenase [Oscillospiraceae bacterium]|nr:NAD(P)-dependent alcohol dehydrogenase [Oscillospiraceae bacterium]
MQITAAVTHKLGQISIENLELAPPKSSEVLIKLVACGVCHTDLAGMNQLIPVALPAVFGHEAVGVVEQVGDGVDTLKKGDRVIVGFPSCGTCPYCIEGRPYACDNLNDLFFTGAYKDGTHRLNQNGVEVSSFFSQGAFADYAIVDSRNAVKVDIDSDDELAKLCSLGCGVMTGAGSVLNRAKPEPGSSLVVFGCGGVGMSAIMAAKIAGCSTIIGVDVLPARLEMSLEVGATHVINAKECDAVEEIKKITNGGANFSIESSGVPALALQALSCLRRTGLAILASVTGPAEVSVPLEPLLMNPSVTLAGLTEGGSNPQVFVPKLVQYYKEGRLPVDKMVKFYDFKDIEKALADTESGVTVKPILRF